MGEVNGFFDIGFNGGGEETDERVHEWEAGLPNADDLTPLCQGLIPSGLLTAFNIKPVPCRTAGDVTRASEDTISMIRGQSPTSNFKAFDENKEAIGGEDEIVEEEGSDSKKSRRNDSPEDADSAAAKTLKRPRLVWTPQLHKRFVEVVAHLGIKNAVPKTIMQLMNVEGLTRENVASHLQKYRLYLKRMQGGSSFEGPSNSSSATEQLFASTPTPANLPENGSASGKMGMPASVPMPYGGPPMMPMPMPMMGMGYGHGHSHHMGMGIGNYGGFESNHRSHQQQQQQQQYMQYGNGMMMMQSGNKYGSVIPYHHHHHQTSQIPPGDK